MTEIIITKNEERRVREIEAFVESDSTEGMYYKTSFDLKEGWKCTCTQFQKKRAICKHIIKTKEQVE